MRAIPMLSARRSGLDLSLLGGAIAASTVSVVLVVLIRVGSGSIDQTLPQTRPFGALIPDILPLVWVGLFAGHCMAYPVLASQVRQPIIAIMDNLVTSRFSLWATGAGRLDLRARGCHGRRKQRSRSGGRPDRHPDL
jgi:hypothetical protein